MNRAFALALLLVLAAAQYAYPIGFGKQGAGFGRMGASNKKPTVSGGCTGVSLSFTTPCNSQYITVIH